MHRPLLPLAAALLVALVLSIACASESASPPAAAPADNSAVVDQHLVAEATLTAHYIAAALEAGGAVSAAQARVRHRVSIRTADRSGSGRRRCIINPPSQRGVSEERFRYYIARLRRRHSKGAPVLC